MLGHRAPRRSDRGPLKFIEATAKTPAVTSTPTIWPAPSSSRARSPGREAPKVPTTRPFPRKRTATARKSRVLPRVTTVREAASGDCCTGLFTGLFTGHFSGLRGGGARATRVEGAEIADLVARGVGAVVTVRADPLRLRTGGEEPQQTGPQPHGSPEEPALEATGDRVAEGTQQGLVHQAVREPAHHPLRRPAVRPERGQEVQGRVCHA